MRKIFILSLVVIYTYADIKGLGFNSDNTIDGVVIKNGSDVRQGDLKIIGSSELKSNIFTLDSTIKNAIIDDSTITQSSVCITSARVENVTIDSKSSIHNTAGTMSIINSTITQSSIFIPTNSTLKNSSITLDSSIKSTKIENSTVSLCNLFIGEGVSVSGITENANCEITDSEIMGANISQGNLVYSQ
jgi:hypothetical protein